MYQGVAPGFIFYATVNLSKCMKPNKTKTVLLLVSRRIQNGIMHCFWWPGGSKHFARPRALIRLGIWVRLWKLGFFFPSAILTRAMKSKTTKPILTGMSRRFQNGTYQYQPRPVGRKHSAQPRELISSRDYSCTLREKFQ